MKAYSRKKNAASGSNGSFWLSFSDMMSVLVLIFIFVIFSMMFTLNEQENKYKQAQEQYLIAEARARASEESEEEMILLLSEANQKLENAEEKLSDAESKLLVIQAELEEGRTIILDLRNENSAMSQDLALLLQEKQMLESNEATLNADITRLQSEIARRKSEYDSLSAQYRQLSSDSQLNSALVKQYADQISQYEKELATTQEQLDQMLGVKTQIIRRLSSELKRNSINVDVDQQTGAIILYGAMLFDSGKIDLKESGQRYLDNFLPVYLSVLLSDEFRPYIAEIVIEGHTDSTGRTGTDAYLYNLELSQQRALAVANYVLDWNYMRRTLRLSEADAYSFRRMVTASGRSFSSLIYDANGTENKEASRRVEIKFSLIDEESVVATQRIINN